MEFVKHVIRGAKFTQNIYKAPNLPTMELVKLKTAPEIVEEEEDDDGGGGGGEPLAT